MDWVWSLRIGLCDFLQGSAIKSRRFHAYQRRPNHWRILPEADRTRGEKQTSWVIACVRHGLAYGAYYSYQWHDGKRKVATNPDAGAWRPQLPCGSPLSSS